VAEKRRKRTKSRSVSANGAARTRRVDRRIRRTRDALGDALVALIREKPFDSITVQDVLDRAGVGRSTFYEHFSDKDDLFFTDVDEFFERMAMHLATDGEASDRVAPVREMFEHVAEARDFVAALRASGRIHDVHELGVGHFARGIAKRLASLPRARGVPAKIRAAQSRALAGAFMSLLWGWMDGAHAGTPEEMDALFHRLVWSGLARG
jgi:AcrR family transcriptional regulator